MLNNNQKGVSLIITFFIMVLVLVVVITVSILLYGQIRIARNISKSVSAYFTAESGIEKILYYNRKVLPDDVKMGVCSIFLDTVNGVSNPDYCQSNTNPPENIDRSIFCNSQSTIYSAGNPSGCDPHTCNQCEIGFETTMSNDSNYVIKATITPRAGDPTRNDFNVRSVGSYKDVKRALELKMIQ